MVVVQMKKAFIIFLALISAFICNELIVRYIIHYPAMNASKRLTGIRDSEGGIQRLNIPHAEYCNVENGYNILHYNNYGLPGRDLSDSKGKINIAVLGSSYVEASQMPADAMAVSVFQDSLSKIDSRYQIVNLGHSGYDTYDMYFEIRYYENIFHPAYVAIVLDQTFSGWLDRHTYPLSFDLPKNFGKEIHSTSNTLEFFARNNFHSLNLLRELLVSDPNREEPKKSEGAEMPQQKGEDLSRLFLTLSKIHELYGSRLYIVSIIPDASSNAQIANFCKNRSISYIYDETLKVPANLINGKGHLNKQGNNLLGNLLYETFKHCYIR
jgi:hypothetical protein